MTRKEIETAYTIDNQGCIRDCGKFESEMLYAPYFYELWNDGAASEDFGTAAFFVINDEDRKEFPEIGSIYGLAIEETETGFIYLAEYETAEAYDKATIEVETAESEDAE